MSVSERFGDRQHTKLGGFLFCNIQRLPPQGGEILYSTTTSRDSLADVLYS
jgi:hypothetical protein